MATKTNLIDGDSLYLAQTAIIEDQPQQPIVNESLAKLFLDFLESMLVAGLMQSTIGAGVVDELTSILTNELSNVLDQQDNGIIQLVGIDASNSNL